MKREAALDALIPQAHRLTPSSARHETILWKIFGMAFDAYPTDSKTATSAMKFVYAEAASHSNVESEARILLEQWRNNQKLGFDPIIFASKPTSTTIGYFRKMKKPSNPVDGSNGLVGATQSVLRSPITNFKDLGASDRRAEIVHRKKMLRALQRDS